MAVAHILTNPTSPYTARQRSFLTKLEQALDEFKDCRNVIIQMRDGDGTQDAHYANVVKQFGVEGYVLSQGDPTAAQLAKARSMFEEIDSAYSKISTDASVDFVLTALNQMFDKLR